MTNLSFDPHPTIKARCFLTDDMKAEVRSIVAELLAERDATLAATILDDYDLMPRDPA